MQKGALLILRFLTDFQQQPIQDGITVGELYKNTKLPLLRFYLTTKKRGIACDGSGGGQ